MWRQAGVPLHALRGAGLVGDGDVLSHDLGLGSVARADRRSKHRLELVECLAIRVFRMSTALRLAPTALSESSRT